ncbi:hypothetical protein BDC45DRAFT_536271 [Circinella umbellata]|nr:hypothetical protein BDC45DRAFT_536271 [Circinella umbellata]
MKIKYIFIILLFFQQSFVTLSVQEATFSTIFNKNTTTSALTNKTQEIERVPLNVVHQIYAQVIISDQSSEHLNNLFQSWKTINDRIIREKKNDNDNQIFRNFAQLYFEYLESSSVATCKNFVTAGILDDTSCLKFIRFLKANIKILKNVLMNFISLLRGILNTF